MRTGASSERYIAFSNIPRSENAPSPNHIYSLFVNYITYLEHFSMFWLSQTWISNMWNIYLVVKKASSIHISILWERGPSRNGKLRYTPFWKCSLSLAYIFHLYELCNLSEIHFWLMIVSNMQSMQVKIHRCTSWERGDIRKTLHFKHSPFFKCLVSSRTYAILL